MTTSGTYNFDPSLGELTLFAFNLCGIRPASLLIEHMQSARMAANLLGARWSGAPGVNLWTVDLQTIPLIQGVATYSLPGDTINMLDTYIVQNDSGSEIDRLILPVSRTEYASYPNKAQQGFPTTYWCDRLISPSVTLWPTPDGTVDALKYYRSVQIQDAGFTSGQTVNIPIYFLEAYAFGLAQRLAMVWAPDKYAMLKAEAAESYAIALNQNVETEAVYISPQIGGYFRP